MGVGRSTPLGISPPSKGVLVLYPVCRETPWTRWPHTFGTRAHPRIAPGRICAILDGLDGLAHQYHLTYFPHVKCEHLDRLDYYEIRDRIRDLELEAAKIWLQEPLQPERDSSQFGLPAVNLVVDGKRSQSGDWKPVPEGKRFHFFLSQP